MKHLIVEGIDRVGKSTLIAALAAELGAKVVKMRVPKTLAESKAFYWDYFFQLADSDEPMVWDRGHISELVYAPLYRPAMVDAAWTRTLRYALPTMALEATVVYVHPGDTSLMKRDEDRPNANRDAELAAFERELRWCPLDVHRVCSHELVDGAWRWRNLEDRVSQVLAGIMGEVPLGY